MFELFNPIGFLVVVLYLYVTVAIGRAEYRAGADAATIIMKAVIWPFTIWNTIKKLYLVDARGTTTADRPR